MALNICRIPRRNRHYSGETLTAPEAAQCLAGNAVQIAPCSAQIPCEQGFLQGIFANLGYLKDSSGQIGVRFNGLAAFSLRARTGNFQNKNREIQEKSRELGIAKVSDGGGRARRHRCAKVEVS